MTSHKHPTRASAYRRVLEDLHDVTVPLLLLALVCRKVRVDKPNVRVPNAQAGDQSTYV